MLKDDLRQKVLADLKSLDSTYKNEADRQMLNQLVSTSIYKEAKYIATYLAFDHEYNTQLLIERAIADGKVILIPKTYPKGRMTFTQYDPNSLEKTSFGLLEPKGEESIDKDLINLIHVPGLVFNSQGYRIGYGGGYYDRYLKDFQGETVSLVYSCQLANFIPDQHDIAVRKMITYDK
ncbi:5-formyltetrahydrofolate cyclo-ligase [Streptococcus dentapri]|uniref:5-formyltetrahydrofolate cyclo-ligase n=1 Tax=Streptococcus dentapri TaxID=573564 RepID=A0ABV8D2R0_9STRE